MLLSNTVGASSYAQYLLLTPSWNSLFCFPSGGCRRCWNFLTGYSDRVLRAHRLRPWGHRRQYLCSWQIQGAGPESHWQYRYSKTKTRGLPRTWTHWGTGYWIPAKQARVHQRRQKRSCYPQKSVAPSYSLSSWMGTRTWVAVGCAAAAVAGGDWIVDSPRWRGQGRSNRCYCRRRHCYHQDRSTLKEMKSREKKINKLFAPIGQHTKFQIRLVAPWIVNAAILVVKASYNKKV